jgi:hypothetical protein
MTTRARSGGPPKEGGGSAEIALLSAPIQHKQQKMPFFTDNMTVS